MEITHFHLTPGIIVGWVDECHLSEKGPFIWFMHACLLGMLSVHVHTSLQFGFEGWIWDLITVSTLF